MNYYDIGIVECMKLNIRESFYFNYLSALKIKNKMHLFHQLNFYFLPIQHMIIGMENLHSNATEVITAFEQFYETTRLIIALAVTFISV